MFEIESVANKMVRIDDTYIPAVNISVGKVDHWNSFRILWEVEDHTWEVFQVTGVGNGKIYLEIRGPVSTLMDALIFDTWRQFKDFYLECRIDPFRGFAFVRAISDEELTFNDWHKQFVS